MSHMWMSHVTHMNESCHTCECVVSQIWVWNAYAAACEHVHEHIRHKRRHRQGQTRVYANLHHAHRDSRHTVYARLF